MFHTAYFYEGKMLSFGGLHNFFLKMCIPNSKNNKYLSAGYLSLAETVEKCINI